MIVKSVLLDGKRFMLVNEDCDPTKNVFSVIIGINGVGKSRLLYRIVDSFNKTDVTERHKIPNYFTHHVEFSSDNKNYCIYSRGGAKTAILGDENRNIDVTPIYTKIIAATTSPFDKFPVEHKKFSTFKLHDDDLYHYIGLRTTENTYNKSNFMHLFARSLLKYGLKEKQVKILALLKYQNDIKLNFKYKFTSSDWSKVFSDTNLKEQGIGNFVSLLNLRCRSVYTNLIKDEKNQTLIERAYSALCACKVEIFNGISIDTEFKNNEELALLLDLGIIQVKNALLRRKARKDLIVNLDEASSGEQSILLTILNIAGVIRDNSIICIDEPEISLHPQWQIEYLKLLETSFREFDNCHFILSTHSPLIIAELSNKNSFILNMEQTQAVASSKYLKKSADYQLAELFDTPGENNEYLNRIVVSLLSKLSRQGKLNRADKKQAHRLMEVSQKLSSQDTVNQLIAILAEAMEKLEHDK